MKIAYITDQYWPTISGVSVSIDVFRKELIKAGHTVYLLAPDHPGAADLDKKMNNRDIFRFKSFGVFFSKERRDRACRL